MKAESLQAFVDALPVPALVFAGGRIAAANRRLADLAGVPVAELLRSPSPFERFVAPEDRQMVRERAEARARGEPVADEVDYMGLRADGARIPSRAQVAPFPAAGDDGILLVISHERARGESSRLIRGFVDVAVAAQRARTVADFFRFVRDSLQALGLASTVLEVEGDRFRFAPYLPALTPAGSELRAELPPWTPLTRIGADVLGADGTLVEDLPGFLATLADRDRAHFVGRAPARAVLTAVRVGGELRYVLAASGSHLDAAVAGAFGLLGRQLAAALETMRYIDEVERRNADLSLLLDLGHEVVGALDLDQVLAASARAAARSLRCSCAYVLLPRADGEALVIAAREDPEAPAEAAVGTELALSVTSLSTLAFRTGRPCSSTDTAADARVDSSVVQRFRGRATLAVPLLSHGRALGVLVLFERSGRAFDALDERFAAHAAQLVAAAVENARLYAEQRARAEEMAQLNEVARALSGSLELRPLLELGGETLRRILGGDYWFIMMRDEAARSLRMAAAQPENGDLVGRVVIRDDEPSITGRAFHERRPLQLTDPGALEGTVARLAARFGNRTTLAVPLLARDEALGVAVILDQNRARSYSQQELDRALAVAGQLALAVLSARLYEDLRGSYAELARTQKELIDRERLAALGELSASIAHEVRNPLGVVFNSVGSLRRILKPQGDTALLLDIIGEEADRLNRMVGDLLDYSRPVRPSLEPVPLQSLIEEALASARQQAGPGAAQVRESVDVSDSVATVRADARLLRQALVNLFLNAFQAMPRGGSLHVGTRAVDADGQRQAEIVVRDTGPGIAAEVADRVFKPFFTTKATGTGLGLAVVRRIVEGHGGAILLVRASTDTGAEFHLRLPLEPPSG